MDLRDETRAVEQAHDAIQPDEYVDRAEMLSKAQDELHTRLKRVIVDIKTLPNGEQSFGKELQIIGQAVAVMAAVLAVVAAMLF